MEELRTADNCAHHGVGTFLDRERLRRGEMFRLEKVLQDISIGCIGVVNERNYKK